MMPYWYYRKVENTLDVPPLGTKNSVLVLLLPTRSPSDNERNKKMNPRTTTNMNMNQSVHSVYREHGRGEGLGGCDAAGIGIPGAPGVAASG